MTDKEALKEIVRQEKRFAEADCGRGGCSLNSHVSDLVEMFKA